jgi:coiled-coil domain-containing protein 77
LVELRKTVSDAQISVHQERETANDQGAMILRLKQQQVEDRKRIQRLLALTQPVVGDITFIQEGSEDAGSALAEQYQVALNNAENEMSKKHSNGILSAQAVASRLQARNESLQLTIDSLKDQLNSYKGIARDKISTLYEDRNIREQQFQKTTESLMSKVELLTKKLNATEDNLNAVTKDYLVLRHNAQVAQRVMIEEKQLLRAEREALEHDRKSAARQMSLEMAAAREASQAEIELATTDFRGQVQARER